MNISDAFRNIRINTGEAQDAVNTLRQWARTRQPLGTRHAHGGIIPKRKRTGAPLKLHGAEGYMRVGGKVYYWKEVGEP